MLLRALLLAASLIFLPWAASFGQTTAPANSTEKLRVGIFERPPFAMKDDDGVWTGLAVNLWQQIALELNLPYEFVETPQEKIVDTLAMGKLDLALGELGVSADRERIIEFTQPYLISSAAIAIDRTQEVPKWRDVWDEMSQHNVGRLIVFMVIALMLFSLFLWLLERRTQKTHFGGKPIHGFGSAVWFSAVTMTTVGYGDKTPQTSLGRTLAFFWMFFGIVLVSILTGTIASSLTVARLHGGVSQLSDLAHYRNGVVNGSLAQAVMSSIGIPARSFETPEDGLRALEQGQIAAFVGSQVTLRYIVQNEYPGKFHLVVLPALHAGYAMAARPGLPQLHAINVSLISRTTTPEWEREIVRWLGPMPDK